MSNNNLQDWLTEAEDDQPADFQDMPEETPEQPQGNLQPTQDFPQEPEEPEEMDSPDDDPQSPDMPDEEAVPDDFETWRSNFSEAVLKGEDPETLLRSLLQVSEGMQLSSSQRKFVDDNREIQRLRTDPALFEASKFMQRKLKDTMDDNSPAASYAAGLADVFNAYPNLRAVLYKLTGYSGMKVELHRKFVAALMGAVQIKSNPETAQLLAGDPQNPAAISTRIATVFGECPIGTWSLKADDVSRYLSEPEQERLEEGSPEERDVLLRRVVVESMSEWFSRRSFLVNFVVEDGGIYGLGWSFETAIKAAYADGTIVVKTTPAATGDAALTEDGIVPVNNISIRYMAETGNVSPDGSPIRVERDFIESHGGALFLSADLPTLQEIADRMVGAELAETPFSGNPEELKLWRRAVFSVHDLLSRTI